MDMNGHEDLECLVFHRPELFEPWKKLVVAQVPGLFARLCIVRSAGAWASYQVYYHCLQVRIPARMRLAQGPGTDPLAGQPCLHSWIETHGAGISAVAPGHPPAGQEKGATYEHVAGRQLTQLAALTVEEREVLLLAARSFDRASAATAKQNEQDKQPSSAGLPASADFGQPDHGAENGCPDAARLRAGMGQAALLRAAFIAELRRRGHNPEQEIVWMPVAVVAGIVNAATNQKKPTNQATAHLRNLAIPELTVSRRGKGRGWTWRGHRAATQGNAIQIKARLGRSLRE